MDDNKIIFNVKKSPVDSRDWIFKKNNLGLPEVLDFRKELLPIRNQGSQGTCYAQSVACMKEWQEKKDRGLNKYLSPQFFYNNRSNLYDNNENNDEGMFGRDVMKLLKTIGICEEEKYPYGLIETRDKIKESCYLMAKKNIIKGFASINDLDSLKESLFKNGPCLIAFPVYNNGIEMWKQSNNEEFMGGHAMCVVGYLKDCFIIRNSWGNNWGDNGYCYYNFEDWGSHWECWTTVDYENQDENQDERPDENQDENQDETPDENQDETPDENQDETPDETPDETWYIIKYKDCPCIIS